MKRLPLDIFYQLIYLLLQVLFLCLKINTIITHTNKGDSSPLPPYYAFTLNPVYLNYIYIYENSNIFFHITLLQYIQILYF